MIKNPLTALNILHYIIIILLFVIRICLINQEGYSSNDINEENGNKWWCLFTVILICICFCFAVGIICFVIYANLIIVIIKPESLCENENENDITMWNSLIHMNQKQRIKMLYRGIFDIIIAIFLASILFFTICYTRNIYCVVGTGILVSICFFLRALSNNRYNCIEYVDYNPIGYDNPLPPDEPYPKDKETYILIQ